MVSARSERAQLILVGSITIALVIVGLTVVVNTVLFTESVGSSSLDNRIDETSEFDSEVISGTRSLVFRLGHNSRNVTERELRAWVTSNITRYSRAAAQSYAASRPVAVSVNFSNASAIGNRTVQSTDRNITDNSGTEDWTVVSAKTVGWFTLNVDAFDTSTDHLYVNASNATSGNWVNISINRTQRNNVSVTSAVSFADDGQGTCTPVDGRVLLDLYAGASLTNSLSPCTFNGTSILDAPYSIRVTNGKNLVGKYSLVTAETLSAYPACDGLSPAAADPCVAPVLWTANVSTAFEGESISHVNTYNVSIYGDDR